VPGHEIEFDWDEGNISHLSKHRVTPAQAEQVILDDPIDLGVDIVKHEDRFVSLGATAQGLILVVVTTWREERVRVVTAFDASKRLVQLFHQQKGT
jgi:uncharacterized DUF497 family protein